MSWLTAAKKKVGNALRKGNDEFWFTDVIPTGIDAVDYSIGGGLGFGRASEFYGNWSSGKTMLLYQTIANHQRLGHQAVLCEAEGAFDQWFFQQLGGNPDLLQVYDAETCEGVFELVYAICEQKIKDKDDSPVVVGWDGIAATSTKHRQEADLDTRDMSKAFVMDQGTKKIRSHLKRARVAFIATNQVRDLIDSKDSATHTPGGKAWPFLASTRIELKFDGGSAGSLIWDKDGKQEIGRHVKGKVTKSKLCTPFRQFALPIYTQTGHPHPCGYGWNTQLGIDRWESLFYLYAYHYSMPGVPAIVNAGSWNKLAACIDPDQTNFRKSEWPQVAQKFPVLWQIPYSRDVYTLLGIPRPKVLGEAEETVEETNGEADGVPVGNE